MIIVPDEKLRKYLAFEDGKWIHDPEMHIPQKQSTRSA